MPEPFVLQTRLWLYRRYAIEPLSALATGRIPLTHDGLHRWPHHVAAQHLRHRLIACGVLPPVDRHLADTECGYTGGWPSSPTIRTSVCCASSRSGTSSPKLPATAATRPLRSTAKPYATPAVHPTPRVPHLAARPAHRPGRRHQADIDSWYATHRVHQRQRVRGFLTWAIEHGHPPRHLVLHRVVFKPGTTITQQRRLALLRRYVTDETAPLPTRVAACLLLLYAQPLTLVHRLTTDDVIEVDEELAIRLGEPPTPVPEPFAELLRQLAAASSDAGTA